MKMWHIRCIFFLFGLLISSAIFADSISNTTNATTPVPPPTTQSAPQDPAAVDKFFKDSDYEHFTPESDYQYIDPQFLESNR